MTGLRMKSSRAIIQLKLLSRTLRLAFLFFFLFDAVKNEIWFCSISQLSVKNSHLLFVSLRNGTIRFSSGTRPIMAV